MQEKIIKNWKQQIKFIKNLKESDFKKIDRIGIIFEDRVNYLSYDDEKGKYIYYSGNNQLEKIDLDEITENIIFAITENFVDEITIEYKENYTPFIMDEILTVNHEIDNNTIDAYSILRCYDMFLSYPKYSNYNNYILGMYANDYIYNSRLYVDCPYLDDIKNDEENDIKECVISYCEYVINKTNPKDEVKIFKELYSIFENNIDDGIIQDIDYYLEYDETQIDYFIINVFTELYLYDVREFILDVLNILYNYIDVNDL